MSNPVEVIITAADDYLLYRGSMCHLVAGRHVRIWRDARGEYLDRIEHTGPLEVPWQWSAAQAFFDRYVNEAHQLRFELVGHRQHGEPKLKRPAELKGIKQSFSADYIPGKCRCSIYIAGPDVWVQHRDYFSPAMPTAREDIGTPLSYRAAKYLGTQRKEKFVYADSWGDIILRSEAWIKVRGMAYQARFERHAARLGAAVTRRQEGFHRWRMYELEDTHMGHFWEQVASKLIKEAQACQTPNS